MNITLNIETGGSGFIATAGPPINASGSGQTIGEAIEKLGQDARQHENSEKFREAIIRVPEGEHPLLKWAGTLPDDELTRRWLQTIKDNRKREREQDKTFEEL